MKLLFTAVVAAVLSLTATANTNGGNTDSKVVVAYVTSWTDLMPDPVYMTHINYAFGHVNDTFNGVRVDNPERLKAIVALKKQNPLLKVLLSIGGWGSGRFSEMAADDSNRKSFARDCRRVVKEFGLDGIDIDWEYPTQSSAGISCSPYDTENFTLLMRDIRSAIGKRKLLTMASVGSAHFVNFTDCIGYLDFVNIMAYDMGNPPYHHSALYPSALNPHASSSTCVEKHLAAGVPKEKIVLGMPFYGRGDRSKPILRDFVKTGVTGPDYTKCWDDTAKVPYLADCDGKLVLGYENILSLTLKCKFIIEQGLRGGMYWDYESDNANHDEARTVFLTLVGLR